MDRLLSMRVFCRVVDEGSFAAAARALDMSGAVVTRLVADLEDHLGTRLIQRTTRRLAVTDAGAEYVERVRHILAEIDEADAGVTELSKKLSGTLHISAPPLLAAQFLTPFAARFRKVHPNIRFDIHADLLDSPSVEDYDITLLVTRAGFDAAVVARHVVTVDSVLVASPAYLRKRGTPRKPSDLADHDCLLHRLPGVPPRKWVLANVDHPTVVEEVQLEPPLTSNHPAVLLRAAVEGAGITSTTVEVVAARMAEGVLVRVLKDWTLERISIYAALPSRRFIPSRVQAFLEFLSAQAPRRPR